MYVCVCGGDYSDARPYPYPHCAPVVSLSVSQLAADPPAACLNVGASRNNAGSESKEAKDTDSSASTRGTRGIRGTRGTTESEQGSIAGTVDATGVNVNVNANASVTVDVGVDEDEDAAAQGSKGASETKEAEKAEKAEKAEEAVEAVEAVEGATMGSTDERILAQLKALLEETWVEQPTTEGAEGAEGAAGVVGAAGAAGATGAAGAHQHVPPVAKVEKQSPGGCAVQ